MRALLAGALAVLADDVRVDRRRLLVEAAGDDFDLAGALQHVHAPQRTGDRGADRQQAVIAQHHRVAALAGDAEGITFFLRRRHAVLVIDQFVPHREHVLADRAQALLQDRYARAGPRVRVHHAVAVRPRLIDAA